MKLELIKKTTSVFILCLIFLVSSGAAFAREGICGYEGGISSGEAAGQTVLNYQEVSFITGEPVVLKGTVTVKKQQRQGKTTTTYLYSLSNTEKSATLTRTLVFTTESVETANGQISETASLARPATETVKIGSTTYTLRRTNGYEFTRSNLIDPQPAVNYHAGSIWSRKVYQEGAAVDGNTVTVECSGTYYGYDQYWGNAESLLLDYVITGESYGNENGDESADKWGGTAKVAISSTSAERLNYQENAPDQISFPGGYVQTRENSSILEYTCILPEFDAKGISTDNMIKYKDSLKLETFPTQKRLPTVNDSSFRGHPAEEDLRIMFGLEIFQNYGSDFNPDLLMTRAEFAGALVQAGREVPEDPALAKNIRIVTNRRNQKEEVVSPYDDVSITNKYFNGIKSAYDRGMLDGDGYNHFKPNGYITRADAIVAFIRLLGFESLAPAPVAVTGFRDNDRIPGYARNAAYVARKIGILQGDERGNMNPTEQLTKGEAATLFNKLILYMQDGIKKDYRERLVNY